MKHFIEWEKEFPRLSDDIVRERLHRIIKTLQEAGHIVIDCQTDTDTEHYINLVLALTDAQLRGEETSRNIDRWIHVVNYSGRSPIGKDRYNLWHIFHESNEDFERVLDQIRRRANDN